jgi:hypothetical protein
MGPSRRACASAEHHHLIPANALDARKARITLQLLLSGQADLARIRTVFDRF